VLGLMMGVWPFAIFIAGKSYGYLYEFLSKYSFMITGNPIVNADNKKFIKNIPNIKEESLDFFNIYFTEFKIEYEFLLFSTSLSCSIIAFFLKLIFRKNKIAIISIAISKIIKVSILAIENKIPAIIGPNSEHRESIVCCNPLYLLNSSSLFTIYTADDKIPVENIESLKFKNIIKIDIDITDISFIFK